MKTLAERARLGQGGYTLPKDSVSVDQHSSKAKQRFHSREKENPKKGTRWVVRRVYSRFPLNPKPFPSWHSARKD